MKKLKSSNQGSSLIEIILAVVILGIITIPLIRTFLVGAHTSKKGAELSDATLAAQNLIERISAVDMDELLENPKVLSKDAKFCEESFEGGSFELNVACICIPQISGGARQFDALITIFGDKDDNSVPIGVYSETDAMINVAGYDSMAASDYIDAYIPVPDKNGNKHTPTIDDLSRIITISASQNNSNPHTKTADYEITVAIEYKSVTDGFSRIYSDSGYIWGVSDPEPDKAAFSVFLIYDAYYKTDKTNKIASYYTQEKIEIRKKLLGASLPDFNVFLLNTSDALTPLRYKLNLEYQNQQNIDQTRVFTNFASEGTSYRVSGSSTGALPVSGYLVEERAKDRRYIISVDLYRAGEGFEGKPVFSLESKRLY